MERVTVEVNVQLCFPSLFEAAFFLLLSHLSFSLLAHPTKKKTIVQRYLIFNKTYICILGESFSKPNKYSFDEMR